MNKIAVLFFIATTVAAVAANPADDRAKFKKAHEECQSDPKTKVSDEFMRKRAQGENVEDENKNAHTLCMSEKLGYIKNGKVDVAEVKNSLSRFINKEDKLEEVTKECAVDKDTAEETAAHLWQCTREHMPKAPQREHHHD